jgi:hypothetical protein
MSKKTIFTRWLTVGPTPEISSACWIHRPIKHADGIYRHDRGAVSCGKIIEWLGIENILPPSGLAKITIEIQE